MASYFASFVKSPSSVPPAGRREPVALGPMRSAHESGIIVVRRGADYAATARTMADLALESACGGDVSGARSFAEDAAVLLSPVDPAETPEAASAFLALGHAMLATSEAHQARAAYEDAVVGFEKAEDLRGAAHARLGLAHALLELHEPAARAVLEDAGAVFEDLGDEAMVASVDACIRDAEARFSASPRSFATAHVPSRLAR